MVSSWILLSISAFRFTDLSAILHVSFSKSTPLFHVTFSKINELLIHDNHKGLTHCTLFRGAYEGNVNIIIEKVVVQQNH